MSSLLNCFLSRLGDNILRELYLLKPHSLHDAMAMMKLIEDKCNAAWIYDTPPCMFPNYHVVTTVN